MALEAKKIPTPDRNIECQKLIAYNDVVHHGHLRKRRTVDKVLGSKNPLKWRHVYVVLRDGCIYFYKTETASSARASSLYGFISVERCIYDRTKEIPWPFKLVCALEERERDYFLCAASERELFTWMKHIEEQIEYAKGFLTTKNPSVAMVRPTMQETDESNATKRPLPRVPNGGTNLTRTVEQLKHAIYVTDSSSSDDEEKSTTNEKFPRVPIGKKTTAPAKTQYETVDDPADSAPAAVRSTESTGKTSGAVAGKATVTVAPNISTKVTKTSEQNLPIQKKPLVTAKPSNTGSTVQVQKSSTRNDSASQSLYVDINGDSAETANNSAQKTQYNKEMAIANAYWDKGADEAEKLMMSLAVEGAYLIRESSDKASQTLMFCTDKFVRKYRINRIDGKFFLDSEGPHFDSVAQLIRHFKTNNLPVVNTEDTVPPLRGTRLTKPYSIVGKR